MAQSIMQGEFTKKTAKHARAQFYITYLIAITCVVICRDVSS